MTEIPLWLYESSLYAVAAFVFAAVMLPLGYWLGYRDSLRRAFLEGYAKGRKTKVVGPFDE